MKNKILVLLTMIQVASTSLASSEFCKGLFPGPNFKGPQKADLPPAIRSPEETEVYSIILTENANPSREQLQSVIYKIDAFLKSRQMRHLHAQTSVAFEGKSVKMWTNPEVAKIVRKYFEQSNWRWIGEFNKVSKKMRPEIVGELDRRDALTRSLAEKAYHALLGINFVPRGKNEWTIESLTPNQLLVKVRADEILPLYEATKRQFDADGLGAINLAKYNGTESAELTYASRRIYALEILAKATQGLTEEGLLNLSLSSSQYYMALRSLRKLSDRIKSTGLRKDFEDSMKEAKQMSDNDIAIRAKSEAILKIVGATGQIIKNAEGDPIIIDLGFALLNRVINNTKLSKLMELDGYTAQEVRNSVRDLTYDYYKDGVEGKLPMLGPQRIKYLEWALHEKHLDERTRLAALNLLRRIKEYGQGSQVALLNKYEIEEIYLKLATRVDPKPDKNGVYSHGFFINETYGTQSEVSAYLVLADKEAERLGIEYVDWSQPEKSAERLSAFLIREIKNQ